MSLTITVSINTSSLHSVSAGPSLRQNVDGSQRNVEQSVFELNVT